MAVRTLSFKKNDSETTSKFDDSDKVIMEMSLSLKKWQSNNSKLKTSLLFKNLLLDSENISSNSLKSKDNDSMHRPKPTISLPEITSQFYPRSVVNKSSNTPKGKVNDSMVRPKPTISLPEPTFKFFPRPTSELDAATVKVQKVYKSYRTQRNLVDCVVVVEELWWKALDFVTLKRSFVSFFNIEEPKTTVSRWLRAMTRVAKVGKGLSKDEKAQKLALQHWLEADNML